LYKEYKNAPLAQKEFFGGYFMKTLKHGIIGILAIIAIAFVFTTCDDGSNGDSPVAPGGTQHKHIYENLNWNGIQHWYQCSCGDKIEITNHVGNPCNFCGYSGGSNVHIHNWGEWGGTTIQGTEQRTCISDPSHIEHRCTGSYNFSFTSAPASYTSYSVYRVIDYPDRGLVIPAYYRPDTNSLFLPVTHISSSAFWDCPNLPFVYIPETVLIIDYGAFQRCSSLTEVIFFTGNVNIRDFAFPIDYGIGSDDLREAYLTGGAGRYTRPKNGNTWTKQ
jgi:hypothetical protein